MKVLSTPKILLNQHAFEHGLYKLLTYGDETKIAQARGKGQSYYAQMFSPDDTRESNFYRAGCDFEAWAEVNPEDADKAFCYFIAEVQAVMKGQGEASCVNEETCKALKETHDIAVIKIKGGSHYDILQEIVQAERQMKKLKHSVLAAINDERDNGGAERFSPRQYAASVVNGRRGSK